MAKPNDPTAESAGTAAATTDVRRPFPGEVTPDPTTMGVRAAETPPILQPELVPSPPAEAPLCARCHQPLAGGLGGLCANRHCRAVQALEAVGGEVPDALKARAPDPDAPPPVVTP